MNFTHRISLKQTGNAVTYSRLPLRSRGCNQDSSTILLRFLLGFLVEKGVIDKCPQCPKGQLKTKIFRHTKTLLNVTKIGDFLLIIKSCLRKSSGVQNRRLYAIGLRDSKSKSL